MKSGIYAIINTSNGKVYVGQSIDALDRINHHKADLKRGDHHNIHLQRAWEQYGEESFVFSILEKCSIEKLDYEEIWWINYFNSTNRDFGYNIEDGGNLFKTVSEETKRRISEANSNPSEEIRKKIGEANFNPSEEKRKKLSEASSLKNSSGIFRVYKENNKRLNQGFQWCYNYTDRKTNKRKVIKSVSILELKKKVLAKELPWKILDEELAKEVLDNNVTRKKQNTTGFYRVSKYNNKQYSKGFAWRYMYYAEGKTRVIKSVSIVKLEKMVKSKDLPWEIIDEELAKKTTEEDKQ